MKIKHTTLLVRFCALLGWLAATSHALAGEILVQDSNGDLYTFTIADDIEIRSDQTLRIPVQEDIEGTPNQPPNAVNDSANITNTDDIGLAVTSNDMDVDGTLNVNSVALVGPAFGGSFLVMAGGIVHFTPQSNFVGTATQQYRVQDTLGAWSNVAGISVQVSGTPCPTDPIPSFVLRGSPTSFDHCSSAQQTFLDLQPIEYFALSMDMDACPITRGSITWETQVGSGAPLRVTISRCPGVFDDSFPPIPSHPDSHLCSSPSIIASQIRWTLADDDFRCPIEPGQQVYLNILYGDNSNPPVPTCSQSVCGFILSPLN